jgi:hypothetical protein
MKQHTIRSDHAGRHGPLAIAEMIEWINNYPPFWTSAFELSESGAMLHKIFAAFERQAKEIESACKLLQEAEEALKRQDQEILRIKGVVELLNAERGETQK